MAVSGCVAKAVLSARVILHPHRSRSHDELVKRRTPDPNIDLEHRTLQPRALRVLLRVLVVSSSDEQLRAHKRTASHAARRDFNFSKQPARLRDAINCAGAEYRDPETAFSVPAVAVWDPAQIESAGRSVYQDLRGRWVDGSGREVVGIFPDRVCGRVGQVDAFVVWAEGRAVRDRDWSEDAGEGRA